MLISKHKIYLIVCTFALMAGTVFASPKGSESEPFTLEQMRKTVQEFSTSTPNWGGPKTGPQAEAGKTIAIIAEDLRNGGVLGVAHGAQEAAQAIGWRVRVFDAGGTQQGREKATADALASSPDGIILDGADAQVMSTSLQSIADEGIPVVGWHVGPVAGPMQGPVSMNVSTDPLEVAKITALAAIVKSNGQAGVVIFTDSNFEIAMAKARVMADAIKSCAGCTLLEIRDVAISDSAKTMPEITRELLQRYGKRWTHGLAINDIYFDYAVPEFIIAGSAADHIDLLSAGDGSSAAFLRIQSRTFQSSTVAEPLNLHGWQLVDELNRLMNGKPVSGYIIPPHLITKDHISEQGGIGFNYDPNNGYRTIYQNIWGR